MEGPQRASEGEDARHIGASAFSKKKEKRSNLARKKSRVKNFLSSGERINKKGDSKKKKTWAGKSNEKKGELRMDVIKGKGSIIEKRRGPYLYQEDSYVVE